MSSPAPTGRVDLAYVGPVSFLRAALCADLTELDAKVAVLGVASDEGSTWQPGARFGPRRLREVSLRFARSSSMSQKGFWDIDSSVRILDELLQDGQLVDCGDVDILPTLPVETWQNVTDTVRQLLDRGAMPVVLGGDHAITYPVVRAYTEPITLIQFDAHMDYQDFTHGITLGHANPMRATDELSHVERIVHAGIRAFRTNEAEVAESRSRGNTVLSVRDIREQRESWLDVVPKGSKVYLTLDMDVLDAPLVPGVNAPEPDGFQFGELCSLVKQVADHTEIVGLDVVEVNPMLDSANQMTAFLAVQLCVFALGHALAGRAGTTASAEDRTGVL